MFFRRKENTKSNKYKEGLIDKIIDAIEDIIEFLSILNPFD